MSNERRKKLVRKNTEGGGVYERAAVPTQSSTTLQKKNRDVVKAMIFGGQPIMKAESESSQLPDDPYSSLVSSGNAIAPPLDLMVLTMMEENNTELRQCIDAMVTNIEGFGGRLVLNMTKEEYEKNKAKIDKERKEIRSFMLNFDPDDDITSLRSKSRRDLELTGNFYWELIPPMRGDMNKIVALKFTESHTIRITKQDDKSTKFEKIEIDPEDGAEYKQVFFKRFRRFVQIRNDKKVYFKEWGDPRVVDRRDGKAYATEDDAKKAGVTRQHYAHAIYQGKIWTARSPYGLPRYVGNLFSIFGSRAAEEINYNTFLNNNVPAMAILVSGNAMLTEGAINRINEFTQSVMKRSNNYSKFLLLEAEPAVDGIQNSGTAKIEIERLKSEQTDDQLFQKYDENNADKIRRAFRLPPIYVGKSADYNRGTAETSRKLAEEQIFSPERETTDRHINKILISMGFKFWRYKSYSPNLTNDEDLIRLLNSVEKTGAMSPNLARKVVGDVMNTELPPYSKEKHGFDPEVPFSLTMAEAVKGAGSLGGNPSTGALAPNQGQVPKPEEDPDLPPNSKLQKPSDELEEDEIEKSRFDGLPVNEAGDIDVTKLVDVFDKLDQMLSKSVTWRDQNAPTSDSAQ